MTRGNPPSGLPPNVRWCRSISGPDLQSLYRSSRIYVHPAPYESCVPNAIREAMAYGPPIVASDVFTYTHELPASVRLFPVAAAERLAEHVIALRSDSRIAEREGRANREYAATHFRWDTATAALVEHVRRAAGRAG